MTRRARRTSRPSPQRKDYDERIYRKGNPPHRVRNALILIVLVIDRHLPGLDEVDPVPEPLRAPRRLQERGEHPQGLAGADRRRQRRQGREREERLRATVSPGTAQSNYSDVTFTVDDNGQPIHSDAQVEIRPRIFLEGNFFLDVSPGSPSAHSAPSGDTIPVTQTSTAVQLDQILTSLQAPDRANLQKLLEGYGTALTHKPSAADDVDPGPGGPGPDRRPGDQQVLRLRADRRPRLGDRQRGAARRPPRTTSPT